MTDEAPPERAMVTRSQRRRAQAMEVTRRQLMKVSFWGVFGFGLTGAPGYNAARAILDDAKVT